MSAPMLEATDLRLVDYHGRKLIVERVTRDGAETSREVREFAYPHRVVVGEAARDAGWCAFPPQLRERAA